MAKVKCIPHRVNKKPGPKGVLVERHRRSTPSKLGKKC